MLGGNVEEETRFVLFIYLGSFLKKSGTSPFTREANATVD